MPAKCETCEWFDAGAGNSYFYVPGTHESESQRAGLCRLTPVAQNQAPWAWCGQHSSLRQTVDFYADMVSALQQTGVAKNYD